MTGRQISIRQVPQNGVVAFQSVLRSNLLNEFKFGYNGAYSRIVGVAPTVNGIDLSNLSFQYFRQRRRVRVAGTGLECGCGGARRFDSR